MHGALAVKAFHTVLARVLANGPKPDGKQLVFFASGRYGSAGARIALQRRLRIKSGHYGE